MLKDPRRRSEGFVLKKPDTIHDCANNQLPSSRATKMESPDSSLVCFMKRVVSPQGDRWYGKPSRRNSSTENLQSYPLQGILHYRNALGRSGGQAYLTEGVV